MRSGCQKLTQHLTEAVEIRVTGPGQFLLVQLHLQSNRSIIILFDLALWFLSGTQSAHLAVTVEKNITYGFQKNVIFITRTVTLETTSVVRGMLSV